MVEATAGRQRYDRFLCSRSCACQWLVAECDLRVDSYLRSFRVVAIMCLLHGVWYLRCVRLWCRMLISGDTTEQVNTRSLLRWGSLLVRYGPYVWWNGELLSLALGGGRPMRLRGIRVGWCHIASQCHWENKTNTGLVWLYGMIVFVADHSQFRRCRRFCRASCVHWSQMASKSSGILTRFWANPWREVHFCLAK